MIRFILFIVVAYGGVHMYTFTRARQAFGFGPAIGIPLALFFVAMVAAVFLIRPLEQREYELTARALSYLAYLWMALLFLFFCISLLFECWGLVLRAASFFAAGIPEALRVPPRTAFLLSAALAAVGTVYGYFEALDIRIERLRIETEKLPAGTDRLTIAQISDVHLGLIVRCDRLVGILEKVNEAKPDVFLSTGDLVDAQINHLPGLRELLQDVSPKFGKYAITGNHEYYAGLGRALEFTRHAGFTLLRNEAKDIGPIVIAGVDDRTVEEAGSSGPTTDHAVLAGIDRTKFVLFLKHRPHPDADAVGLFDLALSGHTHKGQLWPFRFFVRLSYPMLAGLYDLGKGSSLYVNRGSGTWGPPVRLLSPPEVTVIELVAKRSARP